MMQARKRLYEQEQVAIKIQRDEASKNGLARVAVHMPRDWNREEKIQILQEVSPDMISKAPGYVV